MAVRDIIQGIGGAGRDIGDWVVELLGYDPDDRREKKRILSKEYTRDIEAQAIKSIFDKGAQQPLGRTPPGGQPITAPTPTNIGPQPMGPGTGRFGRREAPLPPGVPGQQTFMGNRPKTSSDLERIANMENQDLQQMGMRLYEQKLGRERVPGKLELLTFYEKTQTGWEKREQRLDPKTIKELREVIARSPNHTLEKPTHETIVSYDLKGRVHKERLLVGPELNTRVQEINQNRNRSWEKMAPLYNAAKDTIQYLPKAQVQAAQLQYPSIYPTMEARMQQTKVQRWDGKRFHDQTVPQHMVKSMAVQGYFPGKWGKWEIPPKVRDALQLVYAQTSGPNAAMAIGAILGSGNFEAAQQFMAVRPGLEKEYAKAIQILKEYYQVMFDMEQEGDYFDAKSGSQPTPKIWKYDRKTGKIIK